MIDVQSCSFLAAKMSELADTWQIRGRFLLPPNEQRVRGVIPRNCGEKFFERELAQTTVRFW